MNQKREETEEEALFNEAVNAAIVSTGRHPAKAYSNWVSGEDDSKIGVLIAVDLTRSSERVNAAVNSLISALEEDSTNITYDEVDIK